MRAMVLDKPRKPLQLARYSQKPRPGKGQLLVRIATCAVCRTDLHVVDGELPDPKLPLIPRPPNCRARRRSRRARNFEIRHSRSEIASAFRGLAGPMANALIADRTGKISAITRALPAIPLMAVMPNSLSPMHDSVFICPTATMMSRLRRCFARD